MKSITKTKIKKIVIATICFGVLSLLTIFEIYTITNDDNRHQTKVANEIYDNVIVNFDMIKVAIQISDDKMFEENFESAKNEAEKLNGLPFVSEKDKDYIDEIKNYLELLESKGSLIKETKTLKEAVINLKDNLKEKYGDKEKITKDEIKNASDNIVGLKLNFEDFTFESIKKSTDSINSMLDGFALKTDELEKCIDTCYKNSITAINDGLSNLFKAFADGSFELNENIEKEFELDKIEKIKTDKPEIENESSFSRI